MSVAVRVIPCLDVSHGRVVKGVNFENLRDAGDPVELASRYDKEGADELTFLDVSASTEARGTMLDVVRRTADEVFIPLTVGGGVRSADDVDQLLRAGADKVSINTAAIKRPELLRELSQRFGSQCVVLSVDARRVPDGGTPQPSGFEVTTHGGTRSAGIDAIEWARRGEELGVGEILLNSMDSDGVKQGFDSELISAVRQVVHIPVIASGGAGEASHFPPAIDSGANAVLAASIFHFGDVSISEVKSALAAAGYEVRHTGPADYLLDPSIAARLKRNDRGLVPAVVQDVHSGGVLMQAWMDDHALAYTLATRRGTYWSRSRSEYWVKGMTSGHVQDVREVRLDCDGDTILLKVDQTGAACHTGTHTCFDSDLVLTDSSSTPGADSSTPGAEFSDGETTSNKNRADESGSTAEKPEDGAELNDSARSSALVGVPDLGAGRTTTTREQLRELAAHHRVVPVARKILADGETPLSAYNALAQDKPGTFLFESAEPGRSWSRWSFIGTGARSALTVRDGEAAWLGTTPEGVQTGGNPFDALKSVLKELHTDPIEGMPPMTSGMVGYCGHDAIRFIEDIPDTCDNDLKIPEMMQFLVADMVALDHHEGTMWLIANAFNFNGSDDNVDEAYDDAVRRLDSLTERLKAAREPMVNSFTTPEPVVRRQRTADGHMRRIELCKEHIRAGDAFQIVLSQRFEIDTDVRARDVYRMLKYSNPSPYMYLMNIPSDDFSSVEFTIVGSSPESLIAVDNNVVTTHPIAGSRPRGSTRKADLQLERELAADSKENSEHLMLVDLGRNDLGKVCVPGTVEVDDFRHIERYSHIMHLVSMVTGQLAPDMTAVDAFMAAFPAGTLSGAPKTSALTIIDQLEDTRRGIYGGTVGYFDFSGNTDQAIAIRTGVLKDGTMYVQAGGGIVTDSDPVAEDEETRNKAAAVLRATAAAETIVDVDGSL